MFQTVRSKGRGLGCLMRHSRGLLSFMKDLGLKGLTSVTPVVFAQRL